MIVDKIVEALLGIKLPQIQSCEWMNYVFMREKLRGERGRVFGLGLVVLYGGQK